MSTRFRVHIRKFGKVFAVILLIALLAVGLFYAQSKLFEIQNIEIVGEGVTIVLDEDKIAKNLLFFPSHKVREMLLSQNTLLSDVRFIKKFPHTLMIEPTVRTPIAVLRTQGQAVPIDQTGIILPGAPELAMPVLLFDVGLVHEGQKLTDPRVLQSLRFVSEIGGSLAISSVTTKDGRILVAVYEQSDILFTQDAGVPTLTSTLQTLLTGFRIKGLMPKIIDLRFDKPIVTF